MHNKYFAHSTEPVKGEWYQWMYLSTWMRIGAFLAGIQIGFLLYKYKNKSLKLQWVSYNVTPQKH